MHGRIVRLRRHHSLEFAPRAREKSEVAIKFSQHDSIGRVCLIEFDGGLYLSFRETTCFLLRSEGAAVVSAKTGLLREDARNGSEIRDR